MDLEALKSKFQEGLGSTKLQLSERTLDGMLQDALAEIGDDDTRLTDEFIQRKVSLAKTIDGQINHDVSERINDWKRQQPKPDTGQKDDPDDEMSKRFKELNAKIAALEQERKDEKKKAEKASVLSSVREELLNKFNTAGLKENPYILKQTLRDIEIPDTDADIKALTKEAEKAYYRNLKEAGFDTEPPRAGGQGGQKGHNAADDYFAQKKRKEGWGDKK